MEDETLKRFKGLILLPCLMLLLSMGQVFAEGEEPAATVDDAIFMINNMWVLIAALLVFIMHPGFALLESGLTRSKSNQGTVYLFNPPSVSFLPSSESSHGLQSDPPV